MAKLEKPPALATLTTLENIGHSNTPVNSEIGAQAQDIFWPEISCAEMRRNELRFSLIRWLAYVSARSGDAINQLLARDDDHAIALAQAVLRTANREIPQFLNELDLLREDPR